MKCPYLGPHIQSCNKHDDCVVVWDTPPGCRERGCPICAKLAELEDAEQKIEELSTVVDTRDEKISELESEIDDLELQIENRRDFDDKNP